LIYTYIVCQLDIGYAVVLLSCFATAPAKEHYLTLKGICKYIQSTKNWGLVYWWLSSIDALPDVPLEQLLLDPTLPTFPTIALTDLVSFVDAAHATDLEKQCSITGWVFCYAGAAIAYKSKLQTVIATSSTEA